MQGVMIGRNGINWWKSKSILCFTSFLPAVSMFDRKVRILIALYLLIHRSGCHSAKMRVILSLSITAGFGIEHHHQAILLTYWMRRGLKKWTVVDAVPLEHEFDGGNMKLNTNVTAEKIMVINAVCTNAANRRFCGYLENGSGSSDHWRFTD